MRCYVLALAVAASLGAISRAAEPSRQTLADMGLGGLTVMSDSEALSIRGFGYSGNKNGTAAFGFSWATVSTPVGSAGSINGYTAKGSHLSKGENYSEAGIEITTSGGHGGGGYGASSKNGGGYGGSNLAINAFGGGSSIGKRK